MAEIYRVLNDGFRLRMRSGLTERDLAVAVMAIVEGMSDHSRINPSLAGAPRRLTLGPEAPSDWHLAGIAVYGIYTAFTEPDD